MTNRPIIGIDFSGAALAGEKIWVAHAQFEDDKLVVRALQSAATLPDGAPSRDVALAALTAWLLAFEAPICGFDFPFSLQTNEIDRPHWRDWVLSLPARFASADEFRAHYKGAKRETDTKAKTPFAPLNLRLYRQTYYGIAHILAPLLRTGALALPFESPQTDAPWLLEICPASLLKKHKLYFSYKGKSEAQRENRERILTECQMKFELEVPANLAQIAFEDSEGDALDAILSALCVARALEKNDWAPRNEIESREGRVYF